MKRNITKRFEFGGLYGGADEVVWKSLVVDFPEITLAMTSAGIKKMKSVVAGVIRWQQRLFLECSEPPYELRSYVLGRRRVFPMGDPSPTDVNNNPNQWTGSDIMNVGMSRFLDRLEKAWYRDRVIVLSQVHDAAYIECDDDDRMVMDVGRDIKASWTQCYVTPGGTEIDFPIELKSGYSIHSANAELDAEFGVGRPGLSKLKV
jgi:DNA polymerase I-like protein with 3'-5' exonuclease and polymerase domains